MIVDAICRVMPSIRLIEIAIDHFYGSYLFLPHCLLRSSDRIVCFQNEFFAVEMFMQIRNILYAVNLNSD